MSELSYSLHLGNDKNKTAKARQVAKNNPTKSTSFNNNAIQTTAHLTKVDNHNLRKYDNDQDLIKTIIGSSSIVDDTKNLYVDLFDEARKEYNEKQTREDRKIDDYFQKISDDDTHDLACEIIIELGDMKFWKDKTKEEKMKMIEVYESQAYDLEEVVPNFRIANATIHFDESSPHMHIIGVPYKFSNKNGMSIQVGKSKVFTKDSLERIQDRMRELCIDSFNKVYQQDMDLKEKTRGRNKDILTRDMDGYLEFKEELEQNKENLKILNNKADNLNKESDNVSNIISNLKQSKLNKDNYVISSSDINKINDFITITKETADNVKSTNDLTNTIDKYDKDIEKHTKQNMKYESRLMSSKETIKEKDNQIDQLKNIIHNKNETIRKYEFKINKLEYVLNKVNSFIRSIANFIYKLVDDGYIPKSQTDELEEIGTLFRKPKEHKKKDDYEL